MISKILVTTLLLSSSFFPKFSRPTNVKNTSNTIELTTNLQSSQNILIDTNEKSKAFDLKITYKRSKRRRRGVFQLLDRVATVIVGMYQLNKVYNHCIKQGITKECKNSTIELLISLGTSWIPGTGLWSLMKLLKQYLLTDWDTIKNKYESIPGF